MCILELPAAVVGGTRTLVPNVPNKKYVKKFNMEAGAIHGASDAKFEAESGFGAVKRSPAALDNPRAYPPIFLGHVTQDEVSCESNSSVQGLSQWERMHCQWQQPNPNPTPRNPPPRHAHTYLSQIRGLSWEPHRRG